MADYIGLIIPALMKGAVVSLELFCVTLVLSLPLGLLVCLGENSRIKIISWIFKAYVFVFR